MMSKMILAVLMTFALVASSVAVGHAGGGAGSPITTTLFDCYEIQNGANAPYTLQLTDRFGVHQGVRVGKSRLLCTPTSAAEVEKGPDLNAFDPNLADQLKCYDILGPQPKGPNGAAITISDPLGNETVTLKQMAVLCTPATTDPAIPQ